MTEAEQERADYDGYGLDECWNCGGEGYVYGCSWDWQCDTYDEGEGTCLCTRNCEYCNPVKLTPEQEAERQALGRILSESLNRSKQDEQ